MRSLVLVFVSLVASADEPCPTDQTIAAARARESETSAAYYTAAGDKRADVAKAYKVMSAAASDLGRLVAQKKACDERVTAATQEKAGRDTDEAENGSAAALAAEKQKQAANDAALDRQIETGEARHAVFSAVLCSHERAEKLAMHAIKEERDNSRIAGVVHLARLGEYQDVVAAERGWVREYRKSAKEEKIRLKPCTDKVVRALLECDASDDWDCGAKDTEAALKRAMARVRAAHDEPTSESE